MDGILPPPLMVSEPGSFAEHTVTQRAPQILADILGANPYPAEIASALRSLKAEMATGLVRPLQEEAGDAAFWRRAWLPWEGKTWRQLSWFFAETYFYRRVLEAVHYFQPGHWYHRDPFASQKHQALEDGLRQLASFYASAPTDMTLQGLFTLWLHRSLWGNRFDLSNLQAIDEAQRLSTRGTTEDLLLIDHTQALWSLLSGRGVSRLDIAADNSGLELLSDLVLLDFLLAHGLVERARIHCKPQPFFVSDAMPQDLAMTCAALREHPLPALQGLGARLEQYQQAGRLTVQTHPFWTRCLFYSQLPQDLARTLEEADLLLCKGDVNYRRLLEDRHWPPTTDLAQIVAYMPVPLVALRTLKGELIVGLSEGVAEALDRRDPTWMVNGKRGLIHLVHPQRRGK